MTSQMMQHAQLLAAFALRSPQREISYELAGQLGYLADRLSIERHNFPIIRDRRVAMMGKAVNYGVMRTVFDGFNPAIRGEQMFSNVGSLSCRLSCHIEEYDLDLHSAADTKIIDEICEQYLHQGLCGLASVMKDHQKFPEINHDVLCQDISIADILRAINIDQADEIAREIEDFDKINLIFSIMKIS